MKHTKFKEQSEKDPWQRYKKLQEALDATTNEITYDQYETSMHQLTVEIAEFLLEPYNEMLKEQSELK